MPIQIVQANLLDAQEDLIAHGVNCQGKFNRGIAKQIKEKWPHVRTEYLRKYNDDGWYLGQAQFVMVGTVAKPRPQYVVNVATQENYAYNNQPGVYCSYDAIKSGLDIVFSFADRFNFSIAMPRIGCGLAGGNWTRVLKILRDLNYKYQNVSVKVCVL